MPSFDVFAPSLLRLGAAANRRVSLRGDAIEIETNGQRETIRLADISHVRAGKLRRNQKYTIGPPRYLLFIRRRDGGSRSFRAMQDDLSNYAAFMRAFVPAVKRAAPDSVFECGVGRLEIAGWGVVAVIFWFVFLLAIGTQMPSRMMTGTLETIIFVLAGIGAVAIAVMTIRIAAARRYGAEDLLATELPPP